MARDIIFNTFVPQIKTRNTMKTLVINIKQLVQVEEQPRKWVAGADMAQLGVIDNAYLLVDGDRIEAFGKMEDLDLESVYACNDTVKEIDATGRLVLPSYCDSHTHLVYAGSREIEYIDKIRGLSYEEIARRGGGILNSAERIRKFSGKQLNLIFDLCPVFCQTRKFSFSLAQPCSSFFPVQFALMQAVFNGRLFALRFSECLQKSAGIRKFFPFAKLFIMRSPCTEFVFCGKIQFTLVQESRSEFIEFRGKIFGVLRIFTQKQSAFKVFS